MELKEDVLPIQSLEESFQNILIETLHKGRSSKILLSYWHNGKLSETYNHPIYPLMLEAKNLGHIKYTAAELAIKIKTSSVLAQLGEAFFKNPTDTTALEIFIILASSQHMGEKAIDFSGLNDPDLKWDLAYFLHKRTTYIILPKK